MTWLNRWRRWRRARLLKRVMVPAPVWHRVVERSLARHRLSVAELTRLRELASLFLHEKAISGVDLVPNDTQRVTIAALACLLILPVAFFCRVCWLCRRTFRLALEAGGSQERGGRPAVGYSFQTVSVFGRF